MKLLAIALTLLFATCCQGATVVRILDYRTIELSDGKVVELAGVSGPTEMHAAAKQHLIYLVLDRPVTLEQEQATTWGQIQATVLWRQLSINKLILQRLGRQEQPVTLRYLSVKPVSQALPTVTIRSGAVCVGRT